MSDGRGHNKVSVAVRPAAGADAAVEHGMARPAVSVSDPILLQWYALEVLLGLAKHLSARLGNSNGTMFRQHFADFALSPTPEGWTVASALVERRDDQQPSRLIIFPDLDSVWEPDPECKRFSDGWAVEIEGMNIIYAFAID